MAATDCYRDAELDAVYPRQWPAAAELTLRDGRVLKAAMPHATGEPENPVPREGLVAKFVSLVERADGQELAERILRLDEAGSLGELGL